MIPIFPAFKPLELSDKNEIETFTKDFPAYSDFNFTSLWCWDTQGAVRVCWLFNNLVVKFNDYLTGESFYSFLGETRVNETAEILIRFSVLSGGSDKLRLIPGLCVPLLNTNVFVVDEDRDAFDYIYDLQELGECVGATYEKIRFFSRKFLKQYPTVEVKIITSFDEIKKDILELESKWKENKILKDGHTHSHNESLALQRMLSLNISNILLICIFYEHRLIAFSMSELLPGSQWCLSHFAKADTSFPGIYQFLFKTKAGICTERNIQYFNFEQDLGIEGLRRSKTSLRPVGFLKKFTVSIKNNS